MAFFAFLIKFFFAHVCKQAKPMSNSFKKSLENFLSCDVDGKHLFVVLVDQTRISFIYSFPI